MSDLRMAELDSPRLRARTPMPIDRVRQWIACCLFFTTVEHVAAGQLLGAVWLDPERNGARIGLLVMSGATTLLAVVGSRLILRASWLSWWFLVTAVPPLIGAWLIYWR